MPVVVLVAVALLLPGLASAEVMDKEPTIRAVWSAALLLGTAGLVAWSRRHRVVGTLVGVLTALFVWGRYSELSDPFVGPDILREAGGTYVTQTQFAILLCTLLNLLGLAVQVARFIHAQRSTPA